MKKTLRFNLLIGAAALTALALTGCGGSSSQTNLVAYLQVNTPPVSTDAKAQVHTPVGQSQFLSLKARPHVAGIPAISTVDIQAGTLDAWVVDASTATPKPFKLSSTPGEYEGIQLSRDGTVAVFTADDVLGYTQIFVAYIADFGNPIQVTTSESMDHYQAKFSPDETMITSSVYDYNTDAAELSIIPITANPVVIGTEKLIVPAGLEYAWTPSLTPGNTKVVFQGTVADATSAIYIMNVDGSGLIQLTNPTNTTWDWEPNLTVDGKTLSFTRLGITDGLGNGVNNIAVLSIAVESSTNPAKILTTDGFSWDSQFVKDYIIINDYNNTTGYDNIFKMSRGGTGMVALTSGPVETVWDWYSEYYY